MSYDFKLTCLKCSLVAASLLFLQVGFSQKNEIAFSQAIEAKKGTLGNDFAVLLITPDSVAWQKTYGNFTVKAQVPVSASSQWFTTALLMQLVEEGKISLDDKVSKYLPVFELYGKAYITIRHCLTNMTGIQTEGNKLLKIFERKKFNSLDDAVTGLAKKEIQNNPGLEFRYSNAGFVIAGKVAEVVTKKKFDALIRQRLFTPLGMRNTTFSTLDGNAPDPAAGAQSTAADYGKFLQMLLANGKWGDKQILSEAAITEMRKLQVTKDLVKFAPRAVEGYTYALGSWSLAAASTPSEVSAAVLACPSFFGTWPIVDFTKKYACLFFVKNDIEESNAATYLELKRVADPQFTGNVKH